MILHSRPEKLKKPRPKNSSNQINIFHGIFFGNFSKKLKFYFQKKENIQKKNSVKLIHFISRVFWPGLF